MTYGSLFVCTDRLSYVSSLWCHPSVAVALLFVLPPLPPSPVGVLVLHVPFFLSLSSFLDPLHASGHHDGHANVVMIYPVIFYGLCHEIACGVRGTHSSGRRENAAADDRTALTMDDERK